MRGDGTVSARDTGDGIAVTCACGAALTLPDIGGSADCACGLHHTYDGQSLVSGPPASAPASFGTYEVPIRRGRAARTS